MNPTLLTDADICECLDQYPDVEARAILRRGRLLKAGEVITLCIVARAPHIGPRFTRDVFAPLVDRIMLRWATAGRAPNPQHLGGDQDQGLGARPGAASLAAPALSSSWPAGAQGQPGTPAGRPWEVEWTFTRFPDGRIVLEVPE